MNLIEKVGADVTLDSVDDKDIATSLVRLVRP